MRALSIFAAGFLSISTLVHATLLRAAVPTTQPLTEVKTLDDLLKQPLIAVSTGEKVRVGIGPLDEELGPWRMVFCYVESCEAPADSRARVSSQLQAPPKHFGPLNLIFEPKIRKLQVAYQQSWQSAQRRLPSLYQQVVPLSEDGTIRIYAADDQEIASCDVATPKDRRSAWRRFARATYDENKMLLVLSDDHSPVTPCPGEDRLLPGAKEDADRGSTDLTKLDSLKLELKDGNFVIDAGKRFMTDATDDSLIARWWLNDRPIVSTTEVMRQQLQQWGRAIRQFHVMSIPFGLPADFKDAKPGDRVGLQVMYTAGGCEDYNQQMAQLAKRLAVSDGLSIAISNKIEFVVPEK